MSEGKIINYKNTALSIVGHKGGFLVQVLVVAANMFSDCSCFNCSNV